MAQALAQAPTGSLNLLALLGSRPDTSGLLAAYRSMTFAGVAQTVTSLELQHRISTARANLLMDDLRRGATRQDLVIAVMAPERARESGHCVSAG